MQRLKIKDINYRAAFGYAFIHFSMEVLCFFFLYEIFGESRLWWSIAVIYDTIAFAGQVPVGAFCEKHPGFHPGVWGAVLLMSGAAVGIGAKVFSAEEAVLFRDAGFVTAVFAALLAVSVGNALLHISGALVTLRASGGRLSECGIFVGGGAFGVITGRLLGSGTVTISALRMPKGTDLTFLVPYLLMGISLILILKLDRIVFGSKSAGEQTGAIDKNGGALEGCGDMSFTKQPCMQDIAANRPVAAIVLILAGVVAVRSYISNGIPLQWKQTVFETVMLYVAMGIGKMAGGVLSDLFGARRTGVVSCLLAVPLLLLGNEHMWISLAGILLFSMTMAIALGGIVSVMPSNPGVAFGITTFALFTGTIPVFFMNMPAANVTNILLAVLSLLSAAGIFATIKDPD